MRNDLKNEALICYRESEITSDSAANRPSQRCDEYCQQFYCTINESIGIPGTFCAQNNADTVAPL